MYVSTLQPAQGHCLARYLAVCAGVMPVATPVSEIARYFHDGGNDTLVREGTCQLYVVAALLSDPDLYMRMPCATAECWKAKPLYQDYFLDAPKELIEDRAHVA